MLNIDDYIELCQQNGIRWSVDTNDGITWTCKLEREYWRFSYHHYTPNTGSETWTGQGPAAQAACEEAHLAWLLDKAAVA